MSKLSSTIKDVITSVKGILVIILILVIVGGIVGFVKTKNRIISDYETILTDTTEYFINQREVDGRIISEQKQRITSLEVAVHTGEVTIKELKDRNFKSINTIIRLKTENRILNDSIKYLKDPEIIVVENDKGIPNDYMKVPIGFFENKEWYTAKGLVTKDGVMFKELVMFSEPQIYIGKQWNSDNKIFKYFKGTTPVVTYENNNPNIVVQDLNNIVVVEPKKWWEKKWFWFLFGGATGVAGTGFLLK